MSHDKEFLTIQEAGKIFNLHRSTLYRKIDKGQLKVVADCRNGKNVKMLRISELEALYGKAKVVGDSRNATTGDNLRQSPTVAMRQPATTDIQEQVKKAFIETIQEQQATLLKPLEEQALYRVGRLEELVKHLEAEKEFLRVENETLKSEMKALPDLKQLESLEAEKENQAKKLLEQSENIRILQKEKEVIMDLREQDNTEKEKLLETHKEAEEKHLAEIEELKKKLEEEEKDKQYIEKRLQEELRPWWKKLWEL